MKDKMSKLAARISSKIQKQGTVSLKNETHCKQKTPDLEDEIRGHVTFAEDVGGNFTQSREGFLFRSFAALREVIKV